MGYSVISTKEWCNIFNYHNVTFLITYFVKHLNVSRSEMLASSEKPTVTSWISRGNGVCIAAIGVRIWVAQGVVRYVDVMTTKSGSVAGVVIHCTMLISILSQLNRIISIFVVKREQESFTGWGVTARTWNQEDKRIVTFKRHAMHAEAMTFKNYS